MGLTHLIHKDHRIFVPELEIKLEMWSNAEGTETQRSSGTWSRSLLVLPGEVHTGVTWETSEDRKYRYIFITKA